MNAVNVRLDDVCDIIMGQAPEGGAYNTAGVGWPLIAGAGDFRDSLPDPKKYATVAPKLSKTGDIIVGIRASIGDKVLSNGEYCLGRGVAALRPKPGLNERYLWHWLGWNAAALAAKGRGVTFKQVSRQDIGEMPIRLPALIVQESMAKPLDIVDELRAKRRNAIKLLDDLAQSIFLDMFDNGRRSFTSTLGRYLNFVTSGARGWARYYSPEGVRFVRSLDVRMNEIDNGNAVYVKAPANAEARRTLVAGGDVLLTITGSLIGRVAAAPKSLQGAHVSQHVAILRIAHQSLRPEFLAFYLSLPAGGQRQMAKMRYGQTKPGLNFSQIRSLEVPVPAISAQDGFLGLLNSIGGLKDAHRRHLAELETLFHAFRSMAFSLNGVTPQLGAYRRLSSGVGSALV